jgi:hypothetical protein
MAGVAWSRDGRLVSRISLGRGLVDRICPVLENPAIALRSPISTKEACGLSRQTLIAARPLAARP